MKIPNEFKIVVAFFCVCLIYHIDGLPRHHHNSTAWNNSGRQNATHHRPSHMIGYQNHTNPNNWQPYHRPNQTTDHQNHTNPNNWHPHHRPGRPWQNNHHSHRRNWTQNIPISPQPISNDGGGQFAPTNSGWVAPSNSANSTHWKGGVNNINTNRGVLPQVNNGSNSYPTWHAGLPGSTLVAGTHTENTFPLSNSGQLNGTYSAHPYGKLFA